MIVLSSFPAGCGNLQVSDVRRVCEATQSLPVPSVYGVQPGVGSPQAVHHEGADTFAGGVLCEAILLRRM